MISLLGGMVFLVLGIWGMMTWPYELVQVLKGLVPISLFFAGVVGVVIGFSRFGRSSSRPPQKKDHEKS